MILVKMMGGLGNQLFQFSFGRYLEKTLEKPVILDTAHFLLNRNRLPVLDKLGIKYRHSIVGGYLWYRFNRQVFARYEEKNFSIDRCLTDPGHNMFFWGYWQRAEYANAGKQEILKGFLRFPKRKIVRDLAWDIGESDSLSIHVRRGDYRGIPKFALLHDDYYDRALEAVEADKAEKMFVFSDERSVEEGLLPKSKSYIYMADYGLRDYEEFYLMSLCRRNICANSTFSWWASFLNVREGRRMVMPGRWKTVDDGFEIDNYMFSGVTTV